MRLLFLILLLPWVANAQTITINGMGRTITVNSPGKPSSVTIPTIVDTTDLFIINTEDYYSGSVTFNPSLVYDNDWNYIGIARDSSEVVALWNSDATNSVLGSLSVLTGQSNSFTFSGAGVSVVKGQKNKATKSGTGIFGFGDSITNPGASASPSDSSWINKLALLLGLTLTNYGASGHGVYRALSDAYLNMADSANDKMVVSLAGYNDMRKGGTNAKTTNMMVNSIRALIANSFLKHVEPISSSAITKTGSVSATIQSSAYGGKANRISSINRGATMSAEGDQLSWSFTSDNVVVGFIGSDGVNINQGSFEVKIDGVSQGIFNCDDYADGLPLAGYDHQRVAGALVFTGLTNESHTIDITAQSDCSGSTPAMIDYLGYMMEPASCKPVVIGEILKMTATGYATGSITAGSDVAANQINTAIGNMLKTFAAYPVSFAPTGYYYNPSTTAGTDHVHPNNTGHEQIKTAFERVITL